MNGSLLLPRLWTTRELAGAAIAALVGAVVVGIAWYGSAGERSLQDEVLWLNVAVVGALIAAVGNAVLLLAARARIARARGRLLPEADVIFEGLAPAAAARSASDNGDVVSGLRMTKFHRPSCPLVAGKAVRRIQVGRAGDLSPCGICAP